MYSFQTLSNNEVNNQSVQGGFTIFPSTISEYLFLRQSRCPGQQAYDTISLSPALNGPASKLQTCLDHEDGGRCSAHFFTCLPPPPLMRVSDTQMSDPTGEKDLMIFLLLIFKDFLGRENPTSTLQV